MIKGYEGAHLDVPDAFGSAFVANGCFSEQFMSKSNVQKFLN
jgi:hypothetical protein